jgi:hypothetical protein
MRVNLKENSVSIRHAYMQHHNFVHNLTIESYTEHSFAVT